VVVMAKRGSGSASPSRFFMWRWQFSWSSLIVRGFARDLEAMTFHHCLRGGFRHLCRKTSGQWLVGGRLEDEKALFEGLYRMIVHRLGAAGAAHVKEWKE
jgi:hypothetical protein